MGPLGSVDSIQMSEQRRTITVVSLVVWTIAIASILVFRGGNVQTLLSNVGSSLGEELPAARFALTLALAESWFPLSLWIAGVMVVLSMAYLWGRPTSASVTAARIVAWTSALAIPAILRAVELGVTLLAAWLVGICVILVIAAMAWSKEPPSARALR